MAAATLTETYTPEDLLRLNDGNRYELIDGRLVEKPMGARASKITLRLMGRVVQHTDANSLGDAFESECSYQMLPHAPNRVRRPDGSFIRRGRLPNNQVPEGHIRIAPDMILEVVSPNDAAYEVDQKIEDYLLAGVQLVWIVFPATRRIMVYRLNGTISRLGPADVLNGEDVLPGFSCRIDALFTGLQPESAE